jgi:hypothetical protein
VPDEVVIGVAEERLAQAEALDAIPARTGTPLERCVALAMGEKALDR